jgi:enoyl-CoA hydratase
MTFSHISVTIEQRIATLALADPEHRNRLGLQMRQECMSALKDLEESDTADCVIIAGAGDKAFSAGADINEVRTRTPAAELSTKAQLRRELPALLESLRLPSLACINGWCLGAGLELALACTMRIAGESARLGLPEINLGVIPGSGGTQRLARMIGVGRAMGMITLGEPIDAHEAHRIGLVNSVHPDAALSSAAHEICRKWQAKGPISLMAARDAVLRSADLDLASGIDLERKLFALCLASGERDEGVAAFLEKRQAAFRKPNAK